MKLHLESGDSSNRISAYDEHTVTVAGTAVSQTFLVTRDALHTDVPLPDLADLGWSDLALLHGTDVTILIIGTGRAQRLPAPGLYAELAERGVGLEVMDSAAACRTYNILLGEGRQVAALIVVG